MGLSHDSPEDEVGIKKAAEDSKIHSSMEKNDFRNSFFLFIFSVRIIFVPTAKFFFSFFFNSYQNILFILHHIFMSLATHKC